MFTTTYTILDATAYTLAYAATGNARDAYRTAFPFATAVRNIDRLDQADAQDAFLADLLGQPAA